MNDQRPRQHGKGSSLTRGPVHPLVKGRNAHRVPLSQKLPLSPWLGQLQWGQGTARKVMCPSSQVVEEWGWEPWPAPCPAPALRQPCPLPPSGGRLCPGLGFSQSCSEGARIDIQTKVVPIPWDTGHPLEKTLLLFSLLEARQMRQNSPPGHYTPYFPP